MNKIFEIFSKKTLIIMTLFSLCSGVNAVETTQSTDARMADAEALQNIEILIKIPETDEDIDALQEELKKDINFKYIKRQIESLYSKGDQIIKSASHKMDALKNRTKPRNKSDVIKSIFTGNNDRVQKIFPGVENFDLMIKEFKSIREIIQELPRIRNEEGTYLNQDSSPVITDYKTNLLKLARVVLSLKKVSLEVQKL